MPIFSNICSAIDISAAYENGYLVSSAGSSSYILSVILRLDLLYSYFSAAARMGARLASHLAQLRSIYLVMYSGFSSGFYK